MTALRDSGMSDILAATEKEGMQAEAGERFWTARRVILLIGYVAVFLAGLDILFTGDPTGAVMMIAAALGVLFLHRTWLGVLVWAYVLASGVVAVTSGDDVGFYGVVAALIFGLVALPIWKRRAPQARLAYYWQQSPFMPPSPRLEPQLPIPPPPGETSLPAESATSTVAFKPAIRTIGRIQITSNERDVTSQVVGKPVVGFIWLYLLARQTVRPGDRLTRTALIDEVAHGVKNPRDRLRGYLHDISQLPESIASMVKVEDELIGFDLNSAEADFAELRTLALKVRESNGPVADNLRARAQAVLVELGDGEFLPGFEEMEKRVTKGRGVAGQVVAEARVLIDQLRADVAVAVAEALLDRGQASEAAALLEPIAKRSEDRDDVVRTLSTALRELGQHDRAAEIRRRYAVGQESQ